MSRDKNKISYARTILDKDTARVTLRYSKTYKFCDASCAHYTHLWFLEYFLLQVQYQTFRIS